MITRRVFIGAVGLAVLVTPLAAEAQEAGRVYRLGILQPTTLTPATAGIPAALRGLGYVERQNLVVEQRYAEGKNDRLPGLARELVTFRADVIVAVGSAAIHAAKDATTTIPIVLLGSFDPVAQGLVATLARPGGNITGVMIAPGNALAGKRLVLLKETVPRATRIAFLTREDPAIRFQLEEAQKAASSVGVKLTVVEVRDRDYDRAFATMVAERSGALFIAATPQFAIDRKRIIDLAAKHRLPAIYEWPHHAEEGGLMAYGSSLPDLNRRVAVYVDRILKGANAGDLPIEQPTKYELVINLKTAKALGLTIPPSLLQRADQVIE